MATLPTSSHLYPYPYQYVAIIIAFVILLIFASASYGIYRLIIWKMNIRAKTAFHGFLKVAGISIIVLFFAEMAVSLITIHHVNRQLGFNYATPDTPEGELFEIYEIVPGKTMDKAGLRSGDHVQMRNVNSLYQLLINNQGTEVVIPVLRKEKKIGIMVRVPELDVPLEDVSFLY